MIRTEGSAFVPLCLFVVIAGCGQGAQGTPGGITLRVFRGVSTDEIRITGSQASYPDGRHADIDPARAKQIRETIGLLVRDVPEGIYRNPWHRARSLEVTVDGRRAVYFLGCSDSVWCPPEPLLKAVALIEDAFPVNEAARRHALGEIRSRLAREIMPSKLEVANLDFIIEFTSGYSDVRVNVCWDELKSYGVGQDLKVHVEAESITVERFLGHILSAVNAVSSTKVVASVHSGGVLIGPRSIPEVARHAKGESPISGSRELCVFHVINFGGYDFAQSVGGDGVILYGQRRKNKIARFSDRGLDILREKIRRVLETVPPGHYFIDKLGPEIILEVPVKSGSRLYVLTTLATDPNMPEALNKLFGTMNDLTMW